MTKLHLVLDGHMTSLPETGPASMPGIIRLGPPGSGWSHDIIARNWACFHARYKYHKENLFIDYYMVLLPETGPASIPGIVSLGLSDCGWSHDITARNCPDSMSNIS